jgi:nucleoid-associated protein YgaU
MPRRASYMSGTSKAVVSMCVLLLAALVVYYGMTPPEETQGQLVDLPKQRPSLFGGDTEEKLIALGIPPIATELAQKPRVIPVMPFLPPEPVVIEVEPIVEIPIEVKVVEQTYKTYVVKDGETLGEIASRELGSYRMWREIASLNNIADPSRVMPGRMLRMPAAKTSSKLSVTLQPYGVVPAGANRHIVQEGETMSSIAGEYYDDVNKFGAIINANPEVDPSRLKIGSTLTIPAL